MIKAFFTLFLFSFSFFAFSQDTNVIVEQSGTTSERFPVFAECLNLQSKGLEKCFYNQVQDFVFSNFQVPESLKQNNFNGNLKFFMSMQMRNSLSKKQKEFLQFFQKYNLQPIMGIQSILSLP